jgi:hypothetical protein
MRRRSKKTTQMQNFFFVSLGFDCFLGVLASTAEISGKQHFQEY